MLSAECRFRRQEKETHQVWLARPLVALRAPEALQWALRLQVEGAGLQPAPLLLVREQLWRRQLWKHN